MGGRTPFRHIAAYRRDGVAGLVDGRFARSSSVAGRTDARVAALLEAEVAGQRNLSTGTRSRAINRVQALAGEQGLELPSVPTMYRILKRIEGSRHPFGNATTRRTQANRPDRSWGRQAPARPGELVEIDSTPLDLMVLCPDGTMSRADLTVAISVAVV